MKKKHPHLSTISVLHFVKLFLRSLLFLAVLLAYIFEKTALLTRSPALAILTWVFFVTEMVFRFFPSKLESMGCQKQFAKNFKPISEDAVAVNQSWKVTAAVTAAWLLLNGIFGVLYFTKLIDAGILILISIAFSVCDIICILFFCPFQTWFMKNRCCTTCRIYNWDFAMMFTPLVFIPSLYTWSLLGCALLLLLRWEITYRLHPERFSEKTNACMSCAQCKEKLCSHKKQLQGFLKKYKSKFFPTNK